MYVTELPKFPYETYSKWARDLAAYYTEEELQREISGCNKKSPKYQKQHLDAVKATTSMQSNSQRRAHSGNNLRANYERLVAHQHAIDLHKYYPEKCKQPENPPT